MSRSSKGHLATLIATAALTLSATASAERATGGTIALVNVSVVSTDPADRKAIQKRQTVIVEDGRIVEIGKSKQIAVPEGAAVIDGKKLYVLPGLADLHVHNAGIPRLPERLSPEELYTLYLSNGVTTLLDMSGFSEAFQWRKEINRGKVVGPEIHLTTPIVDEASYGSSLAAVEADIRRWARDGYEYVKSHNVTSPAFFDLLHALGRELAMPVVGHAMRPGFPIQETLARQPLMIAHIEEILSTSATTTVDVEGQLEIPVQDVADSRVWVNTTLAVYAVIAEIRNDETFAALAERPEMSYLPPSIRDAWIQNNFYRRPGFSGDRAFWLTALDAELHIARRLKELGALDRLVLGTDAGIDMIVPGFSTHDELRLLVQAGLMPREAIQVATYNAAAFLGTLDDSGTVEVGKRADLIVVRKSPLKKIGRLKTPEGVIVNGVWLSREELDAQLEALADRWVE